MLDRKFKALILIAATVAPIAGCGAEASHQPTEGHTGTVGHSGGGHALGADPKAALAKIKKGGAKGGANPASLPGR